MNNEQGISKSEVNSREGKSNGRKEKVFDLEERLTDFAILMVEISESLSSSPAGKHISKQIVRSGTSPALHYGEAQSAESPKDFVHKLKVLLKELRETFVALKIIKRVPLTQKLSLIELGLVECNELIAIFVTSIKTAQRNNGRGA